MTLSADLVLLALTPLWPLLLAAALAVPVLRSVALRLIPSAALPALLIAMLPSPDLELALPWLLLGTRLGLDEVSSVFLVFSAILWTAGGLKLPKADRVRFGVWFLVTMAGNFAVLLAGDIPSFFLSYALASLATFGLVIHKASAAARRAGKLYLVFAVFGEMVLLVAMLMVAHNAGTWDLAHVVDRAPQSLLIGLLLVGFGIKAGVPLLHLALPPAYAAAPLAAAVPIAGGMLHLGLYGWIRFLPLGQTEVPVWPLVFAGVGVVAVVYGVVVGLTQCRTRPLLAYSSMSQMGLMTLGVGIGLASPEHWELVRPVLLLVALHHALAKGALFHGLGIRGKARVGLWLPALSLAGLPFTGGALGKEMLKAQVHLLPDAWAVVGAWLLPLASLGTTLLMGRFLCLSYRENTPGEPTAPFAWWLLLVGVLLLPWAWPLPLERTSPLWGALWPVLLGVGLAWLGYRERFSWLRSVIPALPPGDILVLAEKLLQRIPWPHATHSAHEKEVAAVLEPGAIPAPVAVTERFLGRWQVAVGLLLLLILCVFLLVAGL